MAEDSSALKSVSPQKKFYKLRFAMSILYGILIPVTALPFLSALFVYKSTDFPPSFLDWVTFSASILSPLVFLVAFIGGIWCARRSLGARKKMLGRIFLVMPIVCFAIIALIYV
jgi:hypothetical protein